MNRNRPIFFILIIVLSLTAGLVSAQNMRTVLPVSSDLYRLIDNLYYESGLAQPETARPWTYQEVKDSLSKVHYRKLSEAGKQAYDNIQEFIEKDELLVNEDNYQFNTDLILTPEGFYHFELEDTEEEAAQSYEWNHGYDERSSFLDIPLEFWFAESLYMIMDIEVKEEYRTVTSPDTEDVAYNYSNLIFDDPSPRIDIYAPFRAVSSFGGEWWDIYFGRDQLSWGNGLSGNLMLSDYSTYYDFLQMKFRSENFTFTSVYSVLEPFSYDDTSIDYAAFMGHRFEARFWDGRVQAAIAESVTFDEDYSLIHDSNYLMIFHNWLDTERCNSLLSAEVSINPWKYFNIYGQVAMDEFATEYESDRDGGGGPPVFGYMAGGKGAYPLGDGYLSYGAEWVLTSPWMYNRKASPYYYNVRRYWSLVTDQYEYITKPIGYKYGPDSIVWYLTFKYDVQNKYSVGIDYTYLQQGEKMITDSWAPASDDITPTGTVEASHIFNLYGTYKMFEFLSFGADFYWSVINNYNHIESAERNDIEIAAHVIFTLKNFIDFL